MDSLPGNLLLKIFSNIHWRQRLKFETVSKRWNNILLHKSLRMIGCVELDDFVKNDLLLPQAIRSLIAEKRMIINELIANPTVDTQSVKLVLEMIISSQPDSLIHLDIKGILFLMCSVGPLIHLLINLEVLNLEVINDIGSSNPPVSVDLSQLLRLKYLSSYRVHYTNCRSPCLSELKWINVDCDLTHSRPEDRNDFIQMIIVAAPNIEVINLLHVQFSNHGDQYDDIRCKLPKLLKLSINDSSPDLSIALDESMDVLWWIILNVCGVQWKI